MRSVGLATWLVESAGGLVETLSEQGPSQREQHAVDQPRLDQGASGPVRAEHLLSDLGDPRRGETLKPHVASQGDGAGAAMQKATAPTVPPPGPPTSTAPPRQSPSAGKVMATAALNSQNAGFNIIVTRLLGSMTRN